MTELQESKLKIKQLLQSTEECNHDLALELMKGCNIHYREMLELLNEDDLTVPNSLNRNQKYRWKMISYFGRNYVGNDQDSLINTAKHYAEIEFRCS